MNHPMTLQNPVLPPFLFYFYQKRKTGATVIKISPEHILKMSDLSLSIFKLNLYLFVAHMA